jgi:glutaminyl-peptide cyclotransferase
MKAVSTSSRVPMVGLFMRRPDGQTLFLASVLAAAILLVGYLVFVLPRGDAGGTAAAPPLKLSDIPFDGEAAYRVLKDLCDFGPRPSGSEGMRRQQKLLAELFAAQGGNVRWQQFRVRHPLTGGEVPMANLLVEWHPERKERILLCAHYDTRPWPDNDPNPARRRGTFIGANDGASGAAVLAEMGRHMPSLAGPYGVDFVLFDGEEFVFDNDRDPYFLGSTYFARDYAAQPPGHRYRWGVLLDMVGDAHLEIYQERNSVRWRDTRPLVDDIWATARRLGVTEFVPRVRHEVRDDHIVLHDLGGIPTCDIIDFDYPRIGVARTYWHTEADTPDKCSALSLAKVGWVVHEWLKSVK